MTRKPETKLITVTGARVSTLAVFSGARPTEHNGLDCVNRAHYGSLQMRVRTRARRPLWIRLGADRPPDDAEAKLRVEPAGDAVVIDGGPGGFDPTTGGPGGGLPAVCSRADLERSLVAGPRIRGGARALSRRRSLSFRIAVRGHPLCDVELALRGPRGRIYAVGQSVFLKGRRVVRLRRTRQLAKGVYRLEVSARSRLGEREPVRTRVRGRLGK